MKKEVSYLFLIISLITISFTTLASAAPSFDPGEAAPTVHSGSEDIPLIYDLSAAVIDPEPPMTYTILEEGINNQDPSLFPWITLDPNTGTLTIDAATDLETGIFNIEINVANEQGVGSSNFFIFDVEAVNDPPIFENLEDKQFNMTELFEYTITVTDEEGDIPFTYMVEFLSCVVNPLLSTRDCSTPEGRELFPLTPPEYVTDGNAGEIVLSFTPSRNDVGVYDISFTATDSGDASRNPPNAATTETVVFEVLNINQAPDITYACDNELSQTEDTLVSCAIDVTDIDEQNFITYTSNYSWFTFQGGSNSEDVFPLVSGGTDFSLLTSFTPTDSEVGNWDVNLTIMDNTDPPIKKNSTIKTFSIANANDLPIIEQNPTDLQVYTTTNPAKIYINITDDDFLIPDKNIYDEALTLSTNDPRFTVQSQSPTTDPNRIEALITFNPADIGPTPSFLLTITAEDLSLAQDQLVIDIEILGNQPPVWQSPQTVYSLTENQQFSLDLLAPPAAVTDSDGDMLTFSKESNNAFPSFSLDENTGQILFTPTDTDVGQHVVTISADDGKASVPLDFTFVVNNVPDPVIVVQPFPTGTSTNFQGDITNGITVEEDSDVQLNLWVEDEDLLIPAAQKDISYREDITVITTFLDSLGQPLVQPTFDFVLTDSFSSPSLPQGPIPERLEFAAIFTPVQDDVGTYTVQMDISDASGDSQTLNFPFEVLLFNDNPIIDPIDDINTSIFETLNLDVNAFDEESGGEPNLVYSIAGLTPGGDFLTIDPTTGEINADMAGHAGQWLFEVTVEDGDLQTGTEQFTLSVYDVPQIVLPLVDASFFLKEDITTPIQMAATHTVQDDLTYTLLVDGVEKASLKEAGDGTLFLFDFTPDFLSETTCSTTPELTLNVSNPKLSVLRSWSDVEINHTNSPLEFTTDIPDLVGGSPIVINLSNHFEDVDAHDGCTDQTIEFIHALQPGSAADAAITVETVDWNSADVGPEIKFSSTTSASASYNITAKEYNTSNYGEPVLRNITSNIFSIVLSIPTITVPQPTPSSGGGGGGSGGGQTPISLKIIVPGEVSAKQQDRLIIPISLINDGQIDLNGITLSAVIAKNGILRDDLVASFDRSFFESLPVGAEENLTMIVDVDTTSTGLFEVTITADVDNPVYTDSTKFFIEIEEEFEIIERIVFTEELIVNNPECTELKELVDEARTLAERGQTEEARKKTEEAVEACSSAISQPFSSRVRSRVGDRFLGIVGIGSIVAFLAGFAYYYYRRLKLKEAMSQKQLTVLAFGLLAIGSFSLLSSYQTITGFAVYEGLTSPTGNLIGVAFILLAALFAFMANVIKKEETFKRKLALYIKEKR